MRRLLTIVEGEEQTPSLDYKMGYCHAFALAASRLTGLPMVAMRQRDGRVTETCHVYLRLHDGRVFDADGIHGPDAMWENYASGAEDGAVWEDVWDETDIKKAIRRRDLKPLTPEILRVATADARVALDDEGLLGAA